MAERARLLRLRDRLRLVQARADDSLLNYIQWLPGQWRYLTCPDTRKLYRAGNQALGKTTAGLASIHWTASGTHILPRHKPPTESWVVCNSWSQSLAIQSKYWEMVPRAAIDLDVTEFDPRVGFRGRHPTVVYKNGSLVRFRTGGQKAQAMAGATLRGEVLVDEPTSARLYEELSKRCLKTGSTLGICLTPVNGPTDWLREACEEGTITDIHAPLTPEALIPIGADRPMRLDDLHRTPMDAAWIEQLRRNTLSIEEPVTIDGEWETRSTGQLFVAWNPGEMVSERGPRGSAEVCMGIDYGAALRAFAQIGVLVAVQRYEEKGRMYERVYVLDERCADGSSATSANAGQLLSMLRTQGMKWAALDHVHGDTPVKSKWVTKSNITTMKHIARQIGTPYNQLAPRIKRAKSGRGNEAGSVSMGCRFLHQAMVRGDFFVHPRCSRLIEALGKWDYTNSEWKDIVDALRYALKPYIFSRAHTAPRPILRIAS